MTTATDRRAKAEYADWLECKQNMRERQLLTFEQIVTSLRYWQWLGKHWPTANDNVRQG